MKATIENTFINSKSNENYKFHNTRKNSTRKNKSVSFCEQPRVV